MPYTAGKDEKWYWHILESVSEQNIYMKNCKREDDKEEEEKREYTLQMSCFVGNCFNTKVTQ